MGHLMRGAFVLGVGGYKDDEDGKFYMTPIVLKICGYLGFLT
jgi:hypothetical protein